MARKRLADLLREEVQKSAEAEVVPAEVVPAEVVPVKTDGRRRSTTSRSRKPEISEPVAAESPEPVDAVFVEVGNQEDIHDLKLALARSQQREATLEQELATLQTELDQREALVHSLKADLERADSLKTELEQAKEAAFRLAEVNAKLSHELASGQGQRLGDRAPAAPTTGRKLTAPARQSSPSPAMQPAVDPASLLLERQSRSLAHPMFPAGSQPGHLSDQDLGWVD